MRKGTRDIRQEMFPAIKITSLGSIVYDTLQTLKRAENLGWILIALDTIPDDNSFKERNKLIEALIPDEDIRRILVKKRQFRNDSLRVEQTEGARARAKKALTRIYDLTDGLKSSHTRAYRLTFDHFIKTTIKSDDH